MRKHGGSNVYMVFSKNHLFENDAGATETGAPFELVSLFMSTLQYTNEGRTVGQSANPSVNRSVCPIRSPEV